MSGLSDTAPRDNFHCESLGFTGIIAEAADLSARPDNERKEAKFFIHKLRGANREKFFPDLGAKSELITSFT
jgi:hypothetical protein